MSAPRWSNKLERSMAGFDFHVRTALRQRLLVKRLLFFVQRLASVRECRLTFRWSKSGYYYVTIDGRLPDIQSLGYTMLDKLISFAEGYPGPPNLAARRSTAKSIVIAYLAALDKFALSLQGLCDRLNGTPNSFFFHSGKATHLEGKLRNFTLALLLYREGWLAADQIGEECHTLVELLLRRAFPHDDRKAFAALVQQAHDAAYLDRDARDALIILKDFRRKAKHVGQSIPFMEMDALVFKVVPAAHTLLKIVRANLERGKLSDEPA
jgi:hypothetical protein